MDEKHEQRLGVVAVTFEQLWADLGASTKFGLDELVKMISVQDDEKKDFYIHHRGRTLVVRKDKIREYFQTHTKPVPPMTTKQELVYLRERVNALEIEAKSRMGQDKPAEEPKTGPAPDPVDDGHDLPPIEEKTVIPPRDESIPPPEERKKKSLKEIQADLAVELKGKKGAKQKLGESAVPKEIDRAPSA